MDFSFSNLQNLLLLPVWSLLWILGGWWLVHAAFNVQENEEGILGCAVGLVMQTWLANLLGRWVDVPAAFWLSAGAIFITGLVAGFFRDWRSLFRLPIKPAQWIGLLILTYVFLGIERGLAIFDDYAHLPTTSLLAAGYIPPQFALDPAVPYGYHYFLMLFAAEMARIGHLYVWTALDLARALSIGLSAVLVAIWAQRVTRSYLAGFLSACFNTFAMGTRWLLLFVPTNILTRISDHIQMLGSAAQSAPDLLAALTGTWVFEGSGPFAFPFAYANGIYSPIAMSHGPNGAIGAAISIPLLMTFNRWRSWQGFAISLILLSAQALLGETGIVIGLASWGMLTLVYLIQHRTWRIPRSIGKWWLLLAGSIVIAALQGGTWTEIIAGWYERFILGQSAGASYQTIGFSFIWPLSVVSSHLGVLELTNPWQLLVGMLEIGPILLAAPLVIYWGIKSYRSERWYEAVVIFGGYLTLVTFLVQFTGSAGVRNTSRLYSFITTTSFFCMPILYLWTIRRSDLLRSVVLAWASIILFGGLVMFGIELIASQRPTPSTFLETLDSVMYKEKWDRLEEDALIFDPNPYQAVTVFGRYTDSSSRWLVHKPEWEELVDRPDPYAIRQAGFDYMYLDDNYWDELSPQNKALISDECVVIANEVVSESGQRFRRLLDIRGCIH